MGSNYPLRSDWVVPTHVSTGSTWRKYMSYGELDCISETPGEWILVCSEATVGPSMGSNIQDVIKRPPSISRDSGQPPRPRGERRGSHHRDPSSSRLA